MLRRTEKIVIKDETEDNSTPRSASERRGLSALRSAPQGTSVAEDEPPAKPVVEEMNSERWRNEVEPLPQLSPEQRRDIDRWRAEVLRSVSANEDDDVQPSRWRHLFKPTNIALLAVALVAGGAAAFLAMQQPGAPAPTVIAAAPEPKTITQVVEEPKVQVLVAKVPIVVGQRLTPATIEWVEWPEDTTRADFVTQVAAPDALDTMSGAVARYEFFPGEPIREIKLARADRGFLSAVLDPGTRGVSVNVSAESASGGFILPNDRVDVVLTSSVGNKQASTTILDNVRVLAINSQIGETAGTRPQTDEAKNSGASDEPDSDEAAAPLRFATAIATLALNPRQAEVIISATLNGRLSLVLRPTADVADGGGDDAVRATNEAIRISSPFWAN
ncbi:Flp pilus assembly protein CpaB [Devosia sp. CN2-171]|uniref:Flp pilus assembly protein CpaB n=1 Tax=Devosia sp. CN2-171 TaxID=3400909 RepID=UPI003BF78972